MLLKPLVVIESLFSGWFWFLFLQVFENKKFQATMFWNTGFIFSAGTKRMLFCWTKLRPVKKCSLNLLCVLDFFSERWQSTLFQIFSFSSRNSCAHALDNYWTYKAWKSMHDGQHDNTQQVCLEMCVCVCAWRCVWVYVSDYVLWAWNGRTREGVKTASEKTRKWIKCNSCYCLYIYIYKIYHLMLCFQGFYVTSVWTTKLG